jgi:hypothetical protein
MGFTPGRVLWLLDAQAISELGLALRNWRDLVCRPGPRNRSHTIKPIRRIAPAAKSHLRLVGRWVRWARVGSGAAQDCTELGVEL